MRPAIVPTAPNLLLIDCPVMLRRPAESGDRLSDEIPRRGLPRSRSAVVWTPLRQRGARLYGGRFNRIGVPALYTALSPMTALREATPLGRTLQPILLCAYEVDAEPVFDSLNKTQCADHDVTDSNLHCPAWRTVMYGGAVPASQALADRLIGSGFVGMLVRSFRSRRASRGCQPRVLALGRPASEPHRRGR